MSLSSQAVAQEPEEKPKNSLMLAVVYVTALFFIWAFVTNLVDPLIKSMKLIYQLNLFEAMLSQFAFYLAFFVMSLPSAWFLSRFGYARSIVAGLTSIVGGCLIAWSTLVFNSFVTVLIGLFVASSGVTLLQVAANPLIASMGDIKRSHFRLNLSQAFNSLGAFSGSMFGASFLLKGELFQKNVVVTDALKSQGLTFVTNVYLETAGVLAVFTLLVFLARNMVNTHAPRVAQHAASPLKALTSKWANLGALAIFLGVGAEVAVMSGLIFFLEQEHILNVPSQVAGKLAPFFMLFAMFGRFGGSFLLRYFKATNMLTFVGAGGAFLCAVVIATTSRNPHVFGGTINLFGYATPMTTGFVPAAAAILIGLFNSIQFPTIFTLTLERSTAPASATSGLMCMAIFGGGVIPPLYGLVADITNSKSLAFIVPLLCYSFVGWYGMAAKKAQVHAIEEGVTAGHG
jgi:FHS family L-fucose permease-like MFS transporter